MTSFPWNIRLNAIATAAWERWTNNGLRLDEEQQNETMKTVQDAATNAWQDDMSDADWFDATMSRLTREKS